RKAAGNETRAEPDLVGGGLEVDWLSAVAHRSTAPASTAWGRSRRGDRAGVAAGERVRQQTVRTKRSASNSPIRSRPMSLLPSATACASSPEHHQRSDPGLAGRRLAAPSPTP